ncbi:diacylglycerol/lipid kinase family protein [Monashia sp. NPDC004114]
MQDPGPDPAAATARRRLTVVYNPVKVDDLDAAKRLVADAAARHGWDAPCWIETTEDEPGERQSREAVEAGAQVVASLGGDGTVRAVAAALVGSDVALGLLPGGTGNLLARNLGLPVDRLDAAVEALLTGSDRRIDVGFVKAEGGTAQAHTGLARSEDWVSDDSPATAESTSAGTADDSELVFLVMTGLGLDGEVMAETNETVKAAVGWVAYVLAGAKRLVGRGFPVHVGTTTDQKVTRHARTVVVGNCGTLQGGIELLPDARVDDGILDAVVIAPKGPFGWVSVIVDIATRHRAGHGRLDRLRGSRLTVEARHPVEAEIDGEAIGPRSRLDVRVEPEALVVRVG